MHPSFLLLGAVVATYAYDDVYTPASLEPDYITDIASSEYSEPTDTTYSSEASKYYEGVSSVNRHGGTKALIDLENIVTSVAGPDSTGVIYSGFVDLMSAAQAGEPFPTKSNSLWAAIPTSLRAEISSYLAAQASLVTSDLGALPTDAAVDIIDNTPGEAYEGCDDDVDCEKAAEEYNNSNKTAKTTANPSSPKTTQPATATQTVNATATAKNATDPNAATRLGGGSDGNLVTNALFAMGVAALGAVALL